MTSPAGTVHLETGGHAAVLILDRPAKLNALSKEMTAELARHIAAINDSADIGTVVLTGTGRAFCAGSDISELDEYPTPWQFGLREDYGDVLRTLRKPVIAAVNGHALGGGLELALACDIRIAAETASFAAPEIKLGWIGGSGQSALLAHSVGPSNAAVMPLTRAIDYERHLQTICFATSDAAEGRAAFAERRAPEFRGQ
jgi:enoyl-CoA hydratase/carnithine racemase